ncbi:MAG: alpha-L-fucosidase [Bacteroidaceae bacterium]
MIRHFFKKSTGTLLLAAVLLLPTNLEAQKTYEPTPGNLKARQDFANSKFGVFIHWGIYSMFAQGEWFLETSGLKRDEYAKAASGFYPSRFDARAWVKAIKQSGAKYICFTTRHHDGFSMFNTKQSSYNIIDATPFKRDIVKELADACHAEGIKIHFYYSHLDWTRDDYPIGGGSGHRSGRTGKGNWASYSKFMNAQLTELLTNYGEVGAIWFDGWWDHRGDSIPFDWHLEEQYKLIHSLQPSCLIGNNHHVDPFDGEDFQLFERDLPGENKAGYSGQAVDKHLPLETCETMNGSWGYNATDQKFKTPKELIHYLVKAAGKGANLLLNVGPQPNGEIPMQSLMGLKAMGEWTSKYGATIYGTKAGDIPASAWGVTTRNGNKLYVHILSLDTTSLTLPLTAKVKKAICFADKSKVQFKQTKQGVTLSFTAKPQEIDYVVELTTK